MLAAPQPPDPAGQQMSLVERLDGFRYGMQAKTELGPLFEMLGLAVGVALGFGLRPYAGRWLAALLAAAVAAVGSWLQYGFVVPYAAVAFIIVFRGWNAWFGERGKRD